MSMAKGNSIVMTSQRENDRQGSKWLTHGEPSIHLSQEAWSIAVIGGAALFTGATLIATKGRGERLSRAAEPLLNRLESGALALFRSEPVQSWSDILQLRRSPLRAPLFLGAGSHSGELFSRQPPKAVFAIIEPSIASLRELPHATFDAIVRHESIKIPSRQFLPSQSGPLGTLYGKFDISPGHLNVIIDRFDTYMRLLREGAIMQRAENTRYVLANTMKIIEHKPLRGYGLARDYFYSDLSEALRDAKIEIKSTSFDKPGFGIDYDVPLNASWRTASGHHHDLNTVGGLRKWLDELTAANESLNAPESESDRTLLHEAIRNVRNDLDIPWDKPQAPLTVAQRSHIFFRAGAHGEKIPLWNSVQSPILIGDLTKGKDRNVPIHLRLALPHDVVRTAITNQCNEIAEEGLHLIGTLAGSHLTREGRWAEEEAHAVISTLAGPRPSATEIASEFDVIACFRKFGVPPSPRMMLQHNRTQMLYHLVSRGMFTL